MPWLDDPTSASWWVFFFHGADHFFIVAEALVCVCEVLVWMGKALVCCGRGTGALIIHPLAGTPMRRHNGAPGHPSGAINGTDAEALAQRLALAEPKRRSSQRCDADQMHR
jgi:hypothetical protein